jgi:CHAP domain
VTTKSKLAHQRRAAICKEARSLLGIHEIPPHSNTGPDVHRIQSATGAYGAPWCVSTVQYIWKQVLGSTWANDTANAYYLEEYARQHRCAFRKPVAGCAVVYHIGAGHAGTVVKVNEDGTFWAIEGNEADAVRRVKRDPRTLRCTFVIRPELKLR